MKNIVSTNSTNTNMEAFIKNYSELVIAMLLLICLLPMPYGYYQLLRFVAMIYFAYKAFCYYSVKQQTLMATFASLSLLFQPFFKIALGRTVWNVVDVVVALFLIIMMHRKNKNCV